MLIFMSVALLIYGSMHFYAYKKLCTAFVQLSRPMLALIMAALTFSPLMARYTESGMLAWASYLWMGYLFLFLCIGLSLDLARTLSRLAGCNWKPSLIPTLLLALTAMGYGLLEARQIRIETVNISTPKLASGKITIAQISDLHLGVMTRDEFIARVSDKLREIKPDLIVATGDILDGHGDDLDALALQLKSITAPLGCYAVIGNHEQYAGLEKSLNFFRTAGYTVLRGSSVHVGGITLSGVDDPGRRELPKTGKLAAATSVYTVLLKHQPVIDSAMPFDLQLSGHIHGGQIFPFVYLTRLVYSISTGLTQLPDNRLLYVSRGTGSWGPPMRLLAPPEITLFTITGSNSQNKIDSPVAN